MSLGQFVRSGSQPASDPIYARRRLWAHNVLLYQYPDLSRWGYWPIGQARRAACRKRPPHLVPSETCGCGIDAAKPDRFLGSGEVAAMIAGWGRVIEHEHGWRFEQGRIIALIDEGLYSPVEDRINIQLLAKRYGVEVWPL